MGELGPGLYESLIAEGLRSVLDDLDPALRRTHAIDPAEAPDRIALHLARQVEQALAEVGSDTRVEVGIEVARTLLARLTEMTSADTDRPDPAGEVLHAVFGRRPDGSPATMAEPLTPLLDTTLLTNSPDEPNLSRQIQAEIDSADAVDVVMAFVRRSGIRPFVDRLARLCEAGTPVRVLSTTYTGSTEGAALDELANLGAQVRVSYDRTSTRLHAKAWVFHRDSGFSTAYVGSSNLTHSAQVIGLEWNVRVSEARNRAVLEKFRAVFDSYWHSGDFVDYVRDEFLAEAERAGATQAGLRTILSPLEVRPEPFQERLLELIDVSRHRGHHRNLLVAATGTGKTVMAAIDYARLRPRLDRSRLLFVAHRQELLDQALGTFRQVLRDPKFGEFWGGGTRPERFDHVFASVQSLHANSLEHLEPDHFDVVIVDEFHHAAAPTYQRLLDHLEPVELLGLTATPERSDGLPILGWFDDRIAAELRLWDAIDQHRLVPFAYYGIHDGLDLTDIPWRRGQGYDVEALSNLYTSTDAWARVVIQELLRHADRPDEMRCLGFCVSIAHARFMAERFTQAGIPSVVVWGDSPDDERRAALADLAEGRVRVVFSVDLFNEGVDVPAVDTVLPSTPSLASKRGRTRKRVLTRANYRNGGRITRCRCQQGYRALDLQSAGRLFFGEVHYRCC